MTARGFRIGDDVTVHLAGEPDREGCIVGMDGSDLAQVAYSDDGAPGIEWVGVVTLTLVRESSQ